MATAMAGSKAGENIKSGIPTIDESLIENPISRFSAEEIEQIGKEFEALHDEVFDDLGERDAKYIRSMIELQRRMALIARILLVGSKHKPLWLSGTGLLAAAKIIENMEIGHNVLHGQWDWMNDPVINSQCWDWDNVSPASGWKFSHNYVHHTFTNIRGKDRDLGYEIMRIDPHQKWHPVFLLQPLYNLLLMGFFEWGVALHDIDLSAIRKREEPILPIKERLKAIGKKAAGQMIKDYVAFPALSGRHWKKTVAANFTANIIRNVWSHSIIFCGHFPDQTYSFSVEETAEETKGAWYLRQLLGAANIDGSPFFHVMSGNLGYQVEHHLYPDMPSTRYGEIAPKVREICEKWGLPYNTGPLHQQLGNVHRTIIRLAFPGGKPRPKPGPYEGAKRRGSGERETRTDGNGNGNGRFQNA